MEQRKFDKTGFHNATTQNDERDSSYDGVISIINTEKNGKRIELSKSLMEVLENPKKVQFVLSDNTLAISERITGNDISFNVKPSGKKGIVYSAKLICEITQNFELDYSEKRCRTFSDVEYVEDDGFQVALIKIK